jgi:hypothetical protein
MISIGGLTLSNHLILAGLESAAPVAISQKRTVGGKLFYRTSPTIKGRVLTLSGKHHFTHGQIKQLRVMATIGAPLALIHPRGNYSVIVTGISPDPSINYSDPVDGDRYSGEITMLEV